MPVTSFALIGADITGKGHAANVAAHPAARLAWFVGAVEEALGVSLYRGDSVVDGGIHADWFQRFAPTYAAELESFIAAVRTGTPASPDLADGLRAQAVAEAARESLVQARPVRIDNVWR